MKACWSGRGQPVPEVATDRVCVCCGCSEHDPCETAEGPCGWARAELCTACEGRPYDLWMALACLVEAFDFVEEARKNAALGKRGAEGTLRRRQGMLRGQIKRARKVLQPPDRRMG